MLKQCHSVKSSRAQWQATLSSVAIEWFYMTSLPCGTRNSCRGHFRPWNASTDYWQHSSYRPADFRNNCQPDWKRSPSRWNMPKDCLTQQVKKREGNPHQWPLPVKVKRLPPNNPWSSHWEIWVNNKVINVSYILNY